MALQLFIGEGKSIPIPLDSVTLEAWELQFGRAEAEDVIDELSDRLAEGIGTLLYECLDVDLQRPADNQVVVAAEMARRCNLPIPAAALRFRGALADFIGRFVPEYRQNLNPDITKVAPVPHMYPPARSER